MAGRGDVRLKTGLHGLAIECGAHRVSLQIDADRHAHATFEGCGNGTELSAKMLRTISQLKTHRSHRQ